MTGVSTSKECTQERRLARNAFVSNTRPGQQTIENHCAQERAPAGALLRAMVFFNTQAPVSKLIQKKRSRVSDVTH